MPKLLWNVTLLIQQLSLLLDDLLELHDLLHLLIEGLQMVQPFVLFDLLLHLTVELLPPNE